MTSPRSLILPFAATLAVAVVGGATAAPSAEAQGACIQGPKVTKYISSRNPVGLDHSWAKLTWSPEFCPNGKGWRVIGDPVLAETGAGSSTGMGLNVEAPSRHSTGVNYRGQLRDCLPLGAGYAGISYTGKICNTIAKADFGAAINAQRKVTYRFPNLKRTKLGFPSTWVWTDRIV